MSASRFDGSFVDQADPRHTSANDSASSARIDQIPDDLLRETLEALAIYVEEGRHEDRRMERMLMVSPTRGGHHVRVMGNEAFYRRVHGS